jgi:phosphotriesterase-related protein
MHEHIFVLSPEIAANYPLGWDEEERMLDATKRLTELYDGGISTIVDLTVVGLGRYIPRIERLVSGLELNVIVATGVYTWNELPPWFEFRPPDPSGTDVMVEMFIRDIEHGIADTTVRAGVIKCVTDHLGVTPGVERAIRAVAKAHRATGVPISTHSDALSRRGLEQQDILEGEGVDLSRVVIGHSGDTTDISYLEEIVARGSWLGMDRFGLDRTLSFGDRVNVVAEMCARGHHTKMVLSHDSGCFSDWVDTDFYLDQPNWHYLHISNDVVPALRAKGVSDDQINAMLVDNPRRIFETKGSY